MIHPEIRTLLEQAAHADHVGDDAREALLAATRRLELSSERRTDDVAAQLRELTPTQLRLEYVALLSAFGRMLSVAGPEEQP